ncbi:hypothetical protein [Persicobacter psychrovividus]|uniref:Uncharacterized protein n=1 Tax=Persicobacter psychrovividus TaxID=387638 RepID=A0ABN6LGN4_9BACT|nr:hypothetical protein PEPS_45900 [Persicobacter psychrovividus]
MKYVIIFLIVVFCNDVLAQRTVNKQDSIFIYKTLLFVNDSNFNQTNLDEPFIEEFWEENKIEALKYYKEAAYIKSISIVDRVIMIHYLPISEQLELHQWLMDNLESKIDTVSYYRVLDSDYGLNYSDLNIPKQLVYRYCPQCKYD